MAFIRTVKTASNATAVQVVRKEYGKTVVLHHIGSAHSLAERNRLYEQARQKLHEGQPSLFDAREPDIVTLKTVSLLAYTILEQIYTRLHFNALTDEVFKKLVIARLIEPTSKLDSIRVLNNAGVSTPSNSLIHKMLKRVVERDYRSQLARYCFQASQPNHLCLLLYDVTTLYFEIQKEDGFRKPGLSKERRLEPQIVVGLLVDRSGFPLELHEFAGNLAETNTIVPVVTAFCKKHQVNTRHLTITADAGMLSATNLVELEAAGFAFIVGSRIAKTPYQIREFKKSSLDEELADGQIFETTQVFGYRREDKVERRVMYQYRKKRAMLDLSNIDKHIAKAKRIISGQAPCKKATFLTITKLKPALNQALIDEHRLRAGIKGYVTNLPSVQEDPNHGVSALEIIAAYHQLFQVEKSFRMSKSDLKARPIFHRKLDSIRAHLTIVFAALAMARYIENKTRISIKKFVQQLSVLRTSILKVDGETIQAKPQIPSDVENLLKKLDLGH
jgi:transposase